MNKKDRTPEGDRPKECQATHHISDSGFPWYCTLNAGHDGAHEAWASGRMGYMWKDAAPAPSDTPEPPIEVIDESLRRGLATYKKNPRPNATDTPASPVPGRTATEPSTREELHAAKNAYMDYEGDDPAEEARLYMKMADIADRFASHPAPSSLSAAPTREISEADRFYLELHKLLDAIRDGIIAHCHSRIGTKEYRERMYEKAQAARSSLFALIRKEVERERTRAEAFWKTVEQQDIDRLRSENERLQKDNGQMRSGIIEARAIFENGTDYEKKHIGNILYEAIPRRSLSEPAGTENGK